MTGHRFLAAIGIVCAMTGCFLLPRSYVIPDLPTAREQYDVAYDSYRKAQGMLVHTSEKDKKVEEAKMVFRRVGERFPDDPVYTPRAHLMLGRSELIRQEYKKAARYYRTAIEMYPDNKEVQAIGLFELGMALDEAKQHSAAKEAYRQFIERFADDRDADIQQRLSEARKRYRMIRVD